ncbi:FKBP-type peptidyl-prolyl cis-trans isomerase [Jatrophihabitans endophyticus]|uniref:Peptidyl-prolyl cis-trans isomerase n=1 Tax=Jatrophihabitans endophyticus TaxID=1206085 RepID=A0A1M5LK33_9ACTN|nr:FKBP-type peptidyl-prolyl cis-trans isomerase [Jatrophihabitans endophyticus]SHG65326.1 FKBP-type peptidyl-prolyl cis-trans isomerase [Jatrophihabitans endophyticus]
MATNKQRRDAERLRLQRQLDQRRQREAARKRLTLIASVVGTLVVIAVVVVAVIAGTSGGDDDTSAQSGGQPSKTASSSAAASSTAAAAANCDDVAKLKGAVTFQGVTVANPTNLKKEPKVCSAGKADPKALLVKDLVVGKGKAPALTSNVTVQYTGQLYRKGTQFDSSWSRGKAAPFNLQQVVPGFTQGIGGNGKAVKPMKVGGRRIVVMPAALGYGAQANNGIPANSALVFVIDLTKVG